MRRTISIGSDFSGVGAFETALKRISLEKDFDVRSVFACDIDSYSKKSYLENHDAPETFFEDVHERTIPHGSLDVYMTSPPCQSFSTAGLKKGKDDDRGVLFFNSLQFIRENLPRYAIFENVKGLLSDDDGRTFQEWINTLGGKSINGAPVLFPFEDSVPYHLYYKVLNAKDFDVPQNRERVFLILIRDDEDNSFTFPIGRIRTRLLKDILEDEVEEKFLLSEGAVSSILFNNSFQKSKINPDIANTLQLPGNSVGVYKGMNAIKVKSATKQGFEIAKRGDSIDLSIPNSKTRRGRVGNQVSHTLRTQYQQAIIEPNEEEIKFRRLTPRECFRLMDFDDSFKFVVSNTQLYRQSGNSIVCRVLEDIIRKFNL